MPTDVDIKLCNVCILRQRESDHLFVRLDGEKIRMCKKCWGKLSGIFKDHGAGLHSGVDLRNPPVRFEGTPKEWRPNSQNG